MLSNEEKVSIIDQHTRNIEYSKYNLEVSLIEENAVTEPNQEAIDSLNSQLADLNVKLSALDAEKVSLS